jgi:hypothetical protein
LTAGKQGAAEPPSARLARVATAILIGAIYSWAVSATRPFTTAANVTVAIGFVIIGVVMAGCLRRRARSGQAARVGSGRGWAWAVTIGVLAVVELSSYFAGFGASRSTFPTLSYLYDEASRDQAVKALFVFLWMAMGWGLFRPRPGRDDADSR